MYETLIILLLMVLLILLIILIVLNLNKENNEIIYNDEEVIEHKIKNKEKKDFSDKFNIKEYDIINENIIIHNQFKNELLDSKKKKMENYEKKHKYDEIKKKKQNEIINKNAKIIKNDELTKQHNILSKEVSLLKQFFKSDLNNFLNDYNDKKILNCEILEIIKKIETDIDLNFDKLKKIKLYYLDIDNIKLLNMYENVLLEKDDILNKKKNFYIKFLY